MIRHYEDSDVDAVLDVWCRASKIVHGFLDEAFLDLERERIPKDHLPHAETWVYEDTGAVVGFIALLGQEVGAIFVDPATQGRGIGRALMDHARARRSFLELDVFEKNAIGRAFYKRYGFEVVGRSVREETGEVTLRMRLGGA